MQRADQKRRLSVFHPALPDGYSKKTIYRTLARLIVPAGLEYLLLQFVNVFDQIQVGVIGTYAINGVGMVNQIKMIFMTSFAAISVGITALSARAKGQGAGERVRETLRHGLFLTVTVSAAVSVFALLFSERLLRLVGAPDERSFAQGLIYFRICIISFVPSAITTAVTAVLRGLGDAKTPLYYNAAANGVNVFLNWVLINGKLGFPPLGIAGAAIATVIGLMVSFALSCRVFLTGRYGLKLPLRKMFRRPQKGYVSDILRIGLPSMAEQLIMRIGLAMFTRIVSSLNPDVYATHTICVNIQQLTFVNGMAFSVAATTVSGQSLGAKRKDLAAAYSAYCARLCCVFSLLLTVVYAFFGRNLIWLYNKDLAVISAGVVPLRLMAAMQPLSALQYVLSGTIRGAGDTKYVAAATIITTFMVRPLVAYCLVMRFNIGLNGAWIAMVTDQSICSLLIWSRYRTGKWLYAFPSGGKNRNGGTLL